MSPSALSSGPNGLPLPFLHRSHWSPPFSHLPFYHPFCQSPPFAKGRPGGIFSPSFQPSIIPSFRFFLTSIRFPYRFPNKTIRYPVHQELNLSCFSFSTDQRFLLFIIRPLDSGHGLRPWGCPERSAAKSKGGEVRAPGSARGDPLALLSG
jgi:hypothetical protein